ncbi:MAG: hypothetical protein Q8T09_00025 [Candidatus Melainabacteria bacterium]|nr:hypothetical protein [Candidatus Melainabacteria bacterium]
MSEAPGKYFKPIAEGNSPATADKAVENASGQFRHNKVEGDASAAYNQLRADVVKYESENNGDKTKTKAFVETVSKKLEENGLLPAVKIAALRQTDEQESFAPSNPTEQQIKAKLDQQEKTYGIQLLDDSLTKDVQDKIQRDQYLAVLKSIKSDYVQKNKQYFTVEPARGDGKAVVPPTDGKSSVPPTDGTAVVPPTDGTAVVPPTDGTIQPLPDGTAVPPTDGTAVPPTDGTAVVPPADGTAVVPPADGTAVVPPADGTAVVPPTDGTAVVPPTDGTIQPLPDGTAVPPTDGTAVVPPTDGTIQPLPDGTAVPPTDGTAVVPPTDGTAVVPPTDGTIQPLPDGAAVPPTETNPLVPPAATQNAEASSIQELLAKPVADASSVFEQADLAGSGKSEEQTDKLVGKKDLEALIAAPTFDEDLGSQIKSTLIDKWDDAEFQRKYLTNGYLDPAKIQTEVSSTSVSQSPDDSDPADKNMLAKGLDLAKEHPLETAGIATLLTAGAVFGGWQIKKNLFTKAAQVAGQEGAELLGREGAEALGREGAEALGKEGAEALGKEGAEALGKEGAEALGKEGAEGGSTILNKTPEELASEIDNLTP